MLKNNFPRQFGGTHEIGEKFELPKLLGQSFFVGLKVLLLCRVVLSLILIFLWGLSLFIYFDVKAGAC